MKVLAKTIENVSPIFSPQDHPRRQQEDIANTHYVFSTGSVVGDGVVT